MSMNEYGTSKEERTLRVRQARQAKQQAKMEGVAERQHLASLRTPQEQMKRLDYYLGKGCGATRERAKLLKRIENQCK